MAPTVRPLDVSNRADAERVLDIQRRAYRIEAELIAFDGIPPLHETLEEMTAQPFCWLAIRAAGRIVAALGYTLDAGICDIDRLVVDPEHFGRGYGSALVAALLDHPYITVSTGTINTPARRLYERLGFQALGEVEIAPGVTVTRYERREPKAED